MYASFLNLLVEGRHSRALHLKLFTVPSDVMTFFEVTKGVEVRTKKTSEMLVFFIDLCYPKHIR
jgi:hypothetical protein